MPVVVLLAAALCAGVARVAVAAEQRARAQSIADVVALAAAAHGDGAAAVLGAANGARVEQVLVGDDGITRVRVVVGDAAAVAAATT